MLASLNSLPEQMGLGCPGRRIPSWTCHGLGRSCLFKLWATGGWGDPQEEMWAYPYT